MKETYIGLPRRVPANSTVGIRRESRVHGGKFMSCDIQTVLFVFKEMLHRKSKTRMCNIITYTWVPNGVARIFPSMHMLNKAKEMLIY